MTSKIVLPPQIPGVKFFGLDFLEIVYPREYLKFRLTPIDQDNTSFAYHEFTIDGQSFTCKYDKFSPQGYDHGFKFVTVYDGKVVDCFALLMGKKESKITSRDKLVLYSGFFVLGSNGYFRFSIADFLRKYFPFLIASSMLTRLDIALDLDMALPKIIKYFDKSTKFHSTIGDDKKHEWFFQTYYTNNIQSTKNRTRQIRIYDKILDSFVKQKSFLFPHITGAKELRRIEVEIRELYAKRIPYTVFDILDNIDNCIVKLFQDNMATYSSYFSKWGIFLLGYNVKDCQLRKNYIDAWQIPPDYNVRFQGYLRKVLSETGYDGLFQILVDVYTSEQSSKPVRVFGRGVHIPCKRDPLLILDNYVRYLLEKQLVPSRKVWRVLKNFRYDKGSDDLPPSVLMHHAQNIFSQ